MGGEGQNIRVRAIRQGKNGLKSPSDSPSDSPSNMPPPKEEFRNQPYGDQIKEQSSSELRSVIVMGKGLGFRFESILGHLGVHFGNIVVDAVGHAIY